MKKILSLLLTVVLLVTMTTAITTTVFAEGTATKSIMLGTDHITGGQASNVYFGNYYQSDVSGQTKDPIKWRVLSNNENNNGSLFLLADQNLDVQRWHTVYASTTWANSYMRGWLNGTFWNNAFFSGEQSAISKTTLTFGNAGNTDDNIFLLSKTEVNNTNYFPNGDSSRANTNTAYVLNKPTDDRPMWWLRSPGSGSIRADVVMAEGYIHPQGYYVSREYITVRPAFNLNLSSVLFTSAAKDGKADGFNPVGDYSGTDWKLTLLDESRSGFKADIIKTSTKTLVSYSDATTGTNEYISALITDANGNVTYYGRLKNVADTADASGTVEIDLSSVTMNDTDTLYIFNEQYNGDYKTDYASNFVSVDITGADYIESTTITYSVAPTYTVTIPATVELGQTATISAENVVIEKGTQVEVSLTGTSEDDDTFKLKSQEGAELTYTVQNGNADVAVGDTVLTVNPDDSASGETTLSFIPPTGDIQFSGEYTGTVTFTVSVEAAS